MVLGVFLSMLMITSKNLIDSMNKMSKVSGHVYTSQLADGRFVLELTEDGDFNLWRAMDIQGRHFADSGSQRKRGDIEGNIHHSSNLGTIQGCSFPPSL
jgi:hypothetical protein